MIYILCFVLGVEYSPLYHRETTEAANLKGEYLLYGEKAGTGLPTVIHPTECPPVKFPMCDTTDVVTVVHLVREKCEVPT